MQPTKKSRIVKRIINQLNQLKTFADELDLQLQNGGEVGSLLGSLADELEVRLDDGEFDS